MTWVRIAMLAMLTIVCSCAKEGRRDAIQLPHELSVGQVWEYHARPVDRGSTLTICKIEEVAGLGTVVHVSLAGLHIKNPKSASGYSETLPHAPFSKSAIDQSITNLVGHGSPPVGFDGGYQLWKEQHGGAFGIPVADMVDTVEKGLSQ